MSLLAEGRKKTKYGLDPQNTQWSNDSSKVGQRLMEKMGWEKGKGLGANENGMTEHIKASYKWDQSGLGAGPQTSDAWVAHQDDFNDLLKMLNSGKQDDEPEEKDKTSQAKDGHKRYYGRFSRGRVQTLRTTEDLDCIFGRRKSASAPATPSNQSAANSGDEGSDKGGATVKSHGLTTVTSTTSVQDYFAKKMSEMKARQAKSAAVEESEDGVQKSNKNEAVLSSASAVYGMVGFSYGDNEKEESQEKDVTESGEKQSRGWYQSWNLDKKVEGDTGDREEDISKKSMVKKKKKDKKKKSNSVVDEDLRDLNEAETVAELVDGSENAAVLLKDSEQRKSSKKKKKRKNEQESDVCLEISKKTKAIQSTLNDSVLELEEFERNPTVPSTADDLKEYEETDRSSKKKKKRKADKESGDNVERETKKRKTCGEETESDSKGLGLEHEDELVGGDLEENKSKKKKRKEKSQSDSGDLRNAAAEGSSCDLATETPSDKSGVKKKKSKKSKEDDLSDSKDEEVRLATDTPPASNPSEDVDAGSGEKNNDTEKESLSNQTKKRRKKKKKGKQVEKPKKSIFPGSNIEDLDGYGEIKVVSKKETKQVAPKENKPKKKENRLLGRDVDDKIREIAKFQGGMTGKESRTS